MGAQATRRWAMSGAERCPNCGRPYRQRLDESGDVCPMAYAREQGIALGAATANCLRAQLATMTARALAAESRAAEADRARAVAEDALTLAANGLHDIAIASEGIIESLMARIHVCAIRHEQAARSALRLVSEHAAAVAARPAARKP